MLINDGIFVPSNQLNNDTAMQTRKTNYADGQLLEIIETTFHDYPMGTIVKVMHSDWHAYHVVNVTENKSDRRWWWVNENQVKPIKTKLVVIDEHTLAYIQPENPAIANIIHASVWNGSPHPASGQFMLEFKKVRLASERDFKEHGCTFDGYKNRPDEYEFDPTERRPLDSFRKNFDHHGGVECCLVCGKPVRKPYSHWVHLLTTGDLVSSDADFGDDDQGFFPVGPACAKRIGKFAFKTSDVNLARNANAASDFGMALHIAVEQVIQKLQKPDFKDHTDDDFGLIPNNPKDHAELLAGKWVDGDTSV